MTTLLLPNSELVALAWLALVPGLSTSSVGTTLPRMPSNGPLPAWVSTGFVTVAVVGGTPDQMMAQAQPVLSVNCWAVNATVGAAAGPNGPINVQNKPPWDKANQLAEQIRAASYRMNQSGVARRVVPSPSGYAGAAVQSARLLSEPRRMPSDLASYARYIFDLQIFWVAEAL